MPLYAARIEDLGPGGFVKVECAACGHDELIPASALLQGLRLPRLPLCSTWNPAPGRECDTRRKGGSVREVG